MEQTVKLTADTKPDEEHVVKMWTPFDIKVDESYEFIPKNQAFIRFSHGLKAFAVHALSVLTKLVFGLEVEGRENLEKVKGKGYITVCNHVNFLDCGMVAVALKRSDIVFTTIKENFEIPLVRHIIKALGAIPIPCGIKAMQKFSEAVDTMLKKGQAVHFYPEGVMIPYYNGLRGFRKGAFHYAVKSDVPVVPMVITYHKSTSMLKKKPVAKIHILEPVYPDSELSEKEQIKALKTEVFNCMNDKFNSVDCLKDNTAVIEKYHLDK